MDKILTTASARP